SFAHGRKGTDHEARVSGSEVVGPVILRRNPKHDNTIKIVRATGAFGSEAMGWTPPPVTASMCQSGSVKQPLKTDRSAQMKITTVGIDLAKNVFQLHAVDERGKAVLRKQLRREQITPFFANLTPCLIGMEACASAHHWGRVLQRLGHTVRLMAPQ